MWTTGNLRSKSMWITLQCKINSFFPCSIIFRIITTVCTVASVTVNSRCKALAIPDSCKQHQYYNLQLMHLTALMCTHLSIQQSYYKHQFCISKKKIYEEKKQSIFAVMSNCQSLNKFVQRCKSNETFQQSLLRGIKRRSCAQKVRECNPYLRYVGSPKTPVSKLEAQDCNHKDQLVSNHLYNIDLGHLLQVQGKRSPLLQHFCILGKMQAFFCGV